MINASEGDNIDCTSLYS